jgi:hypothetical protein
MKKEPEDRSKLKIASFRTTDGDWFDFSQVAEANGFTATDILKACMVDYQAGAYSPSVNTPVSMRIQSAQGLSAEEVQRVVDGAIEQAIAPIQSDLAELLLSIDAVRNNLDDQGADLADLREKVTRQGAPISEKKPVSSGAQASKPKAAVTKPDGEVGKVVDRLLKDANLLGAVRAELANGGTAAEIADRLIKAGHGTVNGGPHSPAAISRFRAAIAFLDGGTDGH